MTATSPTNNSTPPFIQASPTGGSSNGEAAYFDLGEFTTTLNNFIIWYQPSGPYPTINVPALQSYLTQLFSQMKAAGFSSIDLAFGQVSDIDGMASGDWSALAAANPNDAFAQFMNFVQQYGGGVNVLQMITQSAHAAGMTVDLSMGGANASTPDFNICGLGETPAGQAAKLASFLQKNGFDAVDFDIEGPYLTSSTQTASTVQTFFQSLLSDLTPMGITSTLTVEGGLAAVQPPSGYLCPLFYSSTGTPNFSTMFDGLNLMLYSSSQYYIAANDPSWGIEQWLNLIGPQNAPMLHIGFETGINYADPSSSANSPSPFPIPPNTSPGAAAAMIFQQLEQQLAAAGYPSDLGAPFMWVDEGGTSNPYGVGPGDSPEFVGSFMTDFYNQLNGGGAQ